MPQRLIDIDPDLILVAIQSIWFLIIIITFWSHFSSLWNSRWLKVDSQEISRPDTDQIQTSFLQVSFAHTLGKRVKGPGQGIPLYQRSPSWTAETRLALPCISFSASNCWTKSSVHLFLSKPQGERKKQHEGSDMSFTPSQDASDQAIQSWNLTLTSAETQRNDIFSTWFLYKYNSFTHHPSHIV